MKKLVWLVACCVCFGRDNPFELKIAPKASPHSSKGEITRPLEDVEVTLPTTARVLKEVKFVYQKLDGSTATETIEIDSDIDWHYPISISQLRDKEQLELKKPASYRIADFEVIVVGKMVYLNSSFALKQIFVLPQPFRILLDFDRGENAINESLETQKRFFNRISVGTHQDFYRVTLELDGQYGYDLEQDEKGYRIILK